MFNDVGLTWSATEPYLILPLSPDSAIKFLVLPINNLAGRSLLCVAISKKYSLAKRYLLCRNLYNIVYSNIQRQSSSYVLIIQEIVD